MGEFIIDRWLPDAVRTACQNLGYECKTFSGDWIIRISSDNTLRWIFGYGFDINAQAAAQNANDKVACYQILSEAGLPAMPHYLVRPEIMNATYISQLSQQLGDIAIVLKPLSGTGGHSITKHDSIQRALTYIADKDRPDWSVSPFETIRSECRLFMLDGQVVLSYEKTEPITENGLLFYNLGKGSQAVICKPTAQEVDLARAAVTALGLRVAAVDIVTLTDDSQQIVEVNSGVMMEHFMRQSPEYRQIGYDIYRKIIDAMMGSV